ncbi:MAG: dephospho-CoA kinase [Candidatus Tokpelaia sp. JSC189]|nr:MAG: dephospho-CoA kinase [Candidatus Tokpelaia sp. JSC189]
MIILGLTGSIAMGKSTIACLFAEAEIPVYSADDAIHILYRRKSIIKEISAVFPDAVENGVINHKKLGAMVFGNPELLYKLELIVHPHVYKLETEFLQEAYKQGRKVVVLDIPLLFETGRQNWVNQILVVSAPFKIQHERALKRPDMTEKKFSAILSRQVPDEEKRKQANFTIDTVKNFDAIREEVCSVIKILMDS